jgi:hypothetical protein
MHFAPLLFYLLTLTARTEPLPELTAFLDDKIAGWSEAMETASAASLLSPSERWDFEQFYLQVNPYVGFSAGVAQLQISPQLGFLWVRDAP